MMVMDGHMKNYMHNVQTNVQTPDTRPVCWVHDRETGMQLCRLVV